MVQVHRTHVYIPIQYVLSCMCYYVLYIMVTCPACYAVYLVLSRWWTVAPPSKASPWSWSGTPPSPNLLLLPCPLSPLPPPPPPFLISPPHPQRWRDNQARWGGLYLGWFRCEPGKSGLHLEWCEVGVLLLEYLASFGVMSKGGLYLEFELYSGGVVLCSGFLCVRSLHSLLPPHPPWPS